MARTTRPPTKETAGADFLNEVGRRWGKQHRQASAWSIDPDLEAYEEDEDTGGGTGVVRFARSENASLERESRSGNLVATARAERPKDRPISVQQVLATLYRCMGIDPAQTFTNGSGRPMYLLDDREPVRELV